MKKFNLDKLVMGINSLCPRLVQVRYSPLYYTPPYSLLLGDRILAPRVFFYTDSLRPVEMAV